MAKVNSLLAFLAKRIKGKTRRKGVALQLLHRQTFVFSFLSFLFSPLRPIF